MAQPGEIAQSGDVQASDGVLIVTPATTATARLVVVTPTDLWVRNPPREEVEAAAQAVRGGGDPGAIPAGVSGGRVKLAEVRKVSADIHRADLTIEHGGMMSKKTTAVAFDTPENRDLVLAALDIHLPASYRRSEVQYGAVRAAVAPTFLLALVGFMTVFMYQAAATAAQGGHVTSRSAKGQLFVWIAEKLGVVGVLIVGGLAGLCLAVWLVSRVRRPPLMRTITRA